MISVDEMCTLITDIRDLLQCVLVLTMYRHSVKTHKYEIDRCLQPDVLTSQWE